MKLIQFKVTEQLIRQALAIPEDAEIVSIIRHEYIPGLYTFYVTHPSFPECREGAIPIETLPVVTVNNENRPETWMTIDFRIPDSVLEDLEKGAEIIRETENEIERNLHDIN